MFRRPDEWQIGLTLLKGGYREFREKGTDNLRRELAQLLPEFGARLQASARDRLPRELKRAERWHRKGLLIGDWHVMSPIGGIGINLATRDAVVAANSVLGTAEQECAQRIDLAKVQRKVAGRSGRSRVSRRSSRTDEQRDADKVMTTRSSVFPRLSGIRFSSPLYAICPSGCLFGLVPETAYLPSVGPAGRACKASLAHRLLRGVQYLPYHARLSRPTWHTAATVSG